MFFRAILMPSLYGIEARFLVGKGVPSANLFAIEDNSADSHFDVHDEILHCRLPARQEMKGMRTTDIPTGVAAALDEAWYVCGGRPFNLIYLDFLSQPDYDVHYRSVLGKIFKVPMLLPGATLILNFGRNRCREKTAKFNQALNAAASDITPIQATRIDILVGAAALDSGFKLRGIPKSVSYMSRGHFYTTVFARAA